jgi:hypothetical protein
MAILILYVAGAIELASCVRTVGKYINIACALLNERDALATSSSLVSDMRAINVDEATHTAFRFLSVCANHMLL